MVTQVALQDLTLTGDSCWDVEFTIRGITIVPIRPYLRVYAVIKFKDLKELWEASQAERSHVVGIPIRLI